MPQPITLDLGSRTAVIRGEEAGARLALLTAGPVLKSHLRDLWADEPDLRTPSLRVLLDLAPLALRPGYLGDLALLLGREVVLTPRLRSRLERIRREVRIFRGDLKHAWNDPFLADQALPFARRLENAGYPLWPVQLKDAAFLAACRRGLLCYQMQLGKTRTACAAMIARGYRRLLVVADSQHLPRWRGHFMEFFNFKPWQIMTLSYSHDLRLNHSAKPGELAGQAREALSGILGLAKAGQPVALLVSFHYLAQGSRQRRADDKESRVFPVAKAILKAFRPGAICVDEAHHAKDRKSVHGKILDLLHADMQLGLTGTPTDGIQGNQTHLPSWAASGSWKRHAYPFLRHYRLPGGEESFSSLSRVYVQERRGQGRFYRARLFETPGEREKAENSGSACAEHLSFHARTRNMILVRTEDEGEMKAHLHATEARVTDELVPFSASHALFYSKALSRLALLVDERKETEKKVRLKNRGLPQDEAEEAITREMAMHDQLFSRRFYQVHQFLDMASTCPWDSRVSLPSGERYLEEPAKYSRVLALARQWVTGGEKVVILANFKAYGSRLINDLKAYGVLDLTGGLDAGAKNEAEARFRQDPGSRILILHPCAAGEGFSFAAASRMIVADLDPRLDTFLQALRRIRGPAQLKDTEVRFVLHALPDLAAGGGHQVTVDQLRYQRLLFRKGMAAAAATGKATGENTSWLELAKQLLE